MRTRSSTTTRGEGPAATRMPRSRSSASATGSRCSTPTTPGSREARRPARGDRPHPDAVVCFGRATAVGDDGRPTGEQLPELPAGAPHAPTSSRRSCTGRTRSRRPVRSSAAMRWTARRLRGPGAARVRLGPVAAARRAGRRVRVRAARADPVPPASGGVRRTWPRWRVDAGGPRGARRPRGRGESPAGGGARPGAAGTRADPAAALPRGGAGAGTRRRPPAAARPRADDAAAGRRARGAVRARPPPALPLRRALVDGERLAGDVRPRPRPGLRGLLAGELLGGRQQRVEVAGATSRRPGCRRASRPAPGSRTPRRACRTRAPRAASARSPPRPTEARARRPPSKRGELLVAHAPGEEHAAAHARRAVARRSGPRARAAGSRPRRRAPRALDPFARVGGSSPPTHRRKRSGSLRRASSPRGR